MQSRIPLPNRSWTDRHSVLRYGTLVKIKYISYQYLFLLLCLGVGIAIILRFSSTKAPAICNPSGEPIASSAVFEWYQKPAAVRYVGKFDRTYISWLNHVGEIQIRAFDNRTKQFSEIVTVDRLMPDYGIEAQDDHNAPSMLISPEGEIMLYYVVHDVNNAFFTNTTTNPEDISTWTGRKNIADPKVKTTFNYPQPKRLDNGSLIVFYRRGNYYNADQYFKVSYDNGKTWEPAIKFIEPMSSGVYAVVTTRGNTIHVAWNVTGSKAPRSHVHYLYSSDGGLSWQKRDGTWIELPVTPATTGVVFDSGDEPVAIWDITTDSDNNPFIAFAYKDDPHHELIFASWDQDAWQWSTSLVTTSALLYDYNHFFSGGIVFDSRDPFRVIVSKKRKRLEIEEWQSLDQGKTWQFSSAITTNSANDNFRPQVIENYLPDMKVVWNNGDYEGLINNQWKGYDKVEIQSSWTRGSIPKEGC